MSRRDRLSWLIAVALSLLFSGSFPSALGQERIAEGAPSSNFRVFPRIGPDVRAIKQDSAGRYYILAQPANVVWVYGSHGELVGEIPNARSGKTAIGYAEDIDLDSSGNLYVADRRSNAVDIFRPDGSLLNRVPVFAPLSVAALPDKQFAVVTLRSKFLVSIYDDDGQLSSEFGDRKEVNPGASAESLMDPGKIYADRSGHIYFAYTTMLVPLVRKYDRVGYMAYSAALPVAGTGSSSSEPEDRLQVGINVGQSNFSEQVGGWASLGSSGTFRFGSSVGTGFGQRMRGGFMRSSEAPMSGGFGNAFADGQMGNLNGATFFGEGSIRHGVFHFDTGARLGRRRSGRGSGKNSDNFDGADASGASLLQFSDLTGLYSGENSSTSDEDTEILDANSTDTLASPDGVSDAEMDDVAYEPPLATAGLQPGMFSGNMFFRPHRGGYGPGPGGGALAGRGFGGAHSTASGFTGGASGVPATGRQPGFGPAGHFVFNTYNIEATVRVNLDRPAKTFVEKPSLTAVGIDPQTGEAWVAIGSRLIHLGKDGSLLGSYEIATPNGTPLYPDAILVESDRLLLADDPLGIFSFARPDRSTVSPMAKIAAQSAGRQRSP
ncbi:MAG: hypothetical protein ACRD4R_14940 [Candidatus Acidiferrales bacterium]